ncbi:DUF2255 family protein [Galbitalea sp. SE-J8]|uniref:DUF2255 family protein n=1 Tax=Galbitalea sp. SE-J8 TaxID=3054952 RepID=UPI00259D27AF|nr:DUF2255 family protein [Galbitalea sp. SE-J8]MDM4763316.1 DUF2255 family protein [Galbitalea sp. SE-J8]
MTSFSRADLDRIDAPEEVGISSYRPDGTLRPSVTIWGVATDAGYYVRSAHGPENGWFRRLVASGRGRLRAGGAEYDVTPVQPTDAEQAAVDAAYLGKYARYPSIVRGIVGPAWHPVTLRLDPSVP